MRRQVIAEDSIIANIMIVDTYAFDMGYGRRAVGIDSLQTPDEIIGLEVIHAQIFPRDKM